MNRIDDRYTQFALCHEMLETPDVMRQFEASSVDHLAELVSGYLSIMITGEGSSRIFPAKRAIAEALQNSGPLVPLTEGAAQAMEYNLEGYGLLGASNSGRTRELISLYKKLRLKGHSGLASIMSHPGTPLEAASDAAYILNCGAENAVAATKSVVEQAMVWQAVITKLNNREFPDTAFGADGVAEALHLTIPDELSRTVAGAKTIYFAGRNDGVAEELTLKTNEIVRKPSDYLEGTYVSHGIEEIMSENDVLVLIDPFSEEEAKIKDCLADGVGLPVIAIADRDTLFPTLQVPAHGTWKEYVYLAAGWNLLVEAGLVAGVNLDKTVRARKVGNEYNVEN